MQALYKRQISRLGHRGGGGEVRGSCIFKGSKKAVFRLQHLQSDLVTFGEYSQR